MYTMTLQSVGNPDFNQYEPISEPVTVHSETIEGMRNAAAEYIDHWDLGGGNWVSPVVRDDAGNVIGHFSYNLRFWEGDGTGDWEKQKEIKVGPLEWSPRDKRRSR
jgi:hypothetical protein